MKTFRGFFTIVWSILTVVYCFTTNQPFFESLVLVGISIVLLGVNEVVDLLGRPLMAHIKTEGDKDK